jgi:MoaA/NifB/PqqE/SkfB family radical SAM enzyme
MPLPPLNRLAGLTARHPRYVANLLRNKVRLRRRYMWVGGNPGRDGDVPPPIQYKVLLTGGCNLRCGKCMLWGEKGVHAGNPGESSSGQIDWHTLRDVISQAAPTRPDFILSGGEPLLYGAFRELAILLRQKRCHSVVCTNGTLLDRFADESSGNPYLSYLVSLDGPRLENDALRGEGVHDRVVSNIRLIKSLPKPPHVGVQFAVSPENVRAMSGFCDEMAALGVDWVVLTPRWYLTPQQATEYEDYVRRNFGAQAASHRGYVIPYGLDPDEYGLQMGRIRGTRWPMQVSAYLRDARHAAEYSSHDGGLPGGMCYRQWARMDIAQDASVVACAAYPDIVLGDLKAESVMSAWNSPAYAKLRGLMRRGPMPVCGRCNASFLYDPGKLVH